jgi:ribosomal protein S18 acetylase RimI-like enzyme
MINLNINSKKPFFSSIFTTNSAIWFEKDLSEKNKDFQAKIPVEIDVSSTNQTIDWLKKQNLSWVVYPKEITSAFKYNHIWPSVRSKGKIIGCIKIGFDQIYIADYDKVIKFPDKMAFIYDTYVPNEYRGKNVASYLISQSIKYLKSQGYTKLGCHIPAWNKASITAFEKNGFKKVNYIRYFRIFGIPIRIMKSPNKYSIFNGGKIINEELPYA